MATTNTKICTRCKEEQLTSEFSLRSSEPLRYTSHCKTCTRARWQRNSEKYNLKKSEKYASDPEYRRTVLERNDKYNTENKDKVRKHARSRHRRKRESVIKKYGGACSCCGVSEFEFLAIDHIHGGGTEHRKTFGSTQLIIKLFNMEKVDPAYRVMCHNCNSSVGYYGYCPHSSKG